ncbi:MFS transporter [Streptomyces sp. NPDC086549]|uniref:MFS transporter n=1 Tax=Streptomyces sp. NPDC086549 TaxID=3365752 RepID=UPI0038154094
MRFGPRMPVVTGLLVMATGLGVLSLSPASAPAWTLVALMVPVGAGGSFALPSVTALLLDRVPAERAGTASGVLNASRQIGGALAVAAFGALVTHEASFHDGLRTGLLTAALLVLLATAASLLLRPATRR